MTRARARHDPPRRPGGTAFRSNRDAIARRHRLCLRGPADARPDPAAVDRRQHRADPVLDRIARRLGLISTARESRPRRRLDRELGDQDRPAGGRRLDAVGRQPAAHRARQVAGDRAEAADPRSPDRRRRRRRARRASSRSCAKLAEQGLAILLISDEVPEVYFNADRVLHMAQRPHHRQLRLRAR